MSEQHSRSWYKQPDMLVAVSAVLVSLVALGVGVYSAYVDREFARASVWPSVLLARSYDSEEIGYRVLNQGTGPAIIKYARLKFDGTPVPYWRDLIEQMGFPDAPFVQSHIGSGVIRAGEQVIAFRTKDPELKAYLVANPYLALEICFCSVFDDCWLTDGYEQPTSVETCVVSQSERFLQ